MLVNHSQCQYEYQMLEFLLGMDYGVTTEIKVGTVDKSRPRYYRHISLYI